mmetsp:Transcript_1478/g.1781  ORF Transcript_1478/g.1781 Transcript_1478/m.1781 type:complete len:80 (-) Transcript_1478:938-1177(-)
MQHRAAYEGMILRDNSRLRPFVLTRAFFFGSQKYGPYWTGDNLADEPELAASIKLQLTTGIVGIPWSGADIPGFSGYAS